jgi:hypothetical protein
LDPSGRTRPAEGSAKTSLARGAVLVALLDSSGELSWVGIALIVSTISS